MVNVVPTEPDVLARRDGIVLVTETVDEGGSERVLEALLERFPTASLVAGHFSRHMPPLDGPVWAKRAHLVSLGRHKRHFLSPLYARRFEAVRIGPARLVITLAHHGWSLTAPVPRTARLLCYCAGLPRSLYGRPNLYLLNYPPPLRPLLRAAIPALRERQRRVISRPDRIVTNSRFSANAIAREHGLSSEVVHPPVRTHFFTPDRVPKRHILAVSRLVRQKNLEPLLQAFRGLDESLVVVGRGRWEDRLAASAPPNVRFVGRIPDSELRELYRSARALVCPSVEEFGIVMAEAQACGVPVIAPRKGGACEIVEDPATGILLPRVDASSIAAAVRSLSDISFDPEACRASAERFAEHRFIAEMERIVEEELALAPAAHRAAPVAPPLPV